MKRSILLVLAASLVLFAAPAYAGGGNGHHGHPGPPPPPPPPPPSPSYFLDGSPSPAYYISPGNNSATAVETASPYNTMVETYGAIVWSENMTFSQLNDLSTDVRFVTGSCWGGSPRFELTMFGADRIVHKMFVYIGPAPDYTGCATGVWSNTGNLITPTSLVDDGQFPGGSPYDTFASAEAKYGSDDLYEIRLGTDGGFIETQIVDFDNTQINSTLFTYEP